MEAFEEFVEVVRRLRAPDGCPWDREQTHASLKKGLVEETTEVVCGINVYEQTGNPENLKEELGDLLLHVAMQAQIAQEEGLFDIRDVLEGITEKLIRRHPHVFGEVRADGAKEALASWDAAKAKEKAGNGEGTADVDQYLPAAFDEVQELIGKARAKKGI